MTKDEVSQMKKKWDIPVKEIEGLQTGLLITSGIPMLLHRTPGILIKVLLMGRLEKTHWNYL